MNDDTAEASTADAITAKSGTAEAGTAEASTAEAGTAKAGKITGTQAEITNCLRVVLFMCVRFKQVITALRNKTLQNHLQYRCVQFTHAHFQYKNISVCIRWISDVNCKCTSYKTTETIRRKQ